MAITSFSPLSNVRILSDVPLDSSYSDTLYFSSVSEQTAFFTGKTKYSFSQVAPVRLPNSVRLDIVADNLYDCNYIMFQNANYKSKWFYGFITAIEWINVNACVVTYEIDAIQTWFFDMEINECMVEREHSATDEIGDNLQPEPVDCSEYVLEPGIIPDEFDSYTGVVLSTYNSDFYSAPRGVFAGTFTGGYVYFSSLSSTDEKGEPYILHLIDEIVTAGQQDTIFATFVMPTAFLPLPPVTDYITSPILKDFTYQHFYNAIGNYIPRNKKLFTYPYDFLFVTSGSGSSKIYRFEYFENKSSYFRHDFIMQASVSANCEIIAYPIDYNGQAKNTDESLIISGFPQFAYNVDTYKAWVAQNSSSYNLNMLQSTIGLIGSIASIPATGPMGIASAASSATSLLQTANAQVQASNASDVSRGTQGTNVLQTMGRLCFIFYEKHLREDVLERIDDFFDRYGYATNLLKKPNLNTRQSWNYVKTEKANITGKVPFDDLAKIKQCFNNGITFWHGDFVGDYSRSNNPV
uniref:Major tail protein n=1 Tax=Podoviridae sp. ctC8s18 TaxID=2827617 RepID=A0A8S5LQL3_9CAUD|nr:MAG TPA: Major tail protein [Podoviridae sp. ctC8s18]